MADLIVIGGGLAGSEAAWQAAERGLHVELYEMRPGTSTGAHQTGGLAELVCSNSLGSEHPERAPGLLKAELRLLGSMVLACAEATRVPAGSALAVDRAGFSAMVSQRVEGHPRIRVIRQELTRIPDGPCIVASGPLTSSRLAAEIGALSGQSHLFFFDAISPIVAADSVDMSIAFRASRNDRGDEAGGDYINCPLNREEYGAFVEALTGAERIRLKEFEAAIESGVSAGAAKFFEGCLPIEILAARGERALAFGPMRPVGITDPRTGRWPHAVLQLRQDDLSASMYNLVGFQTNLTFPEQRRVLRMIPGLGQAEFLRYGQMHRNTFINSPDLLLPTLQFKTRSDLFFAGQLTGVEGYAGNIGTGLLAGINAARVVKGEPPMKLPSTTMLGALCHYVTHASAKDFQPMKANFGILPPLESPPRSKAARGQAYGRRAIAALQPLIETGGGRPSILS